MRYYSTRDARRSATFSLKEAAFAGLAPDGGLFMPERIPQADLEKVLSLSRISYADMAGYLAGLFFGDDVPGEELDEMVRRAYDFPCPLVRVDGTLSVLELFHGPTLAFKDFGARFMGGMLALLRDARRPLTVLTATSGDTGSAVAAGFLGVPGIDVVVLYPDGQVSPLQEAQMTTLGGNIHPVRVKGTFDDCQALVKAVFNDAAFREGHDVTSANSINILRWIPQSFYYFHAWAQWISGRRQSGAASEPGAGPDIVVPSGNYGNITAGMLAAAMGMPVRRFIAASNANSVVPDYLRSGEYRPGPSVRTVANAMDVGNPSNYERMMDLYGGYDNLRRHVEGYSYSDARILEAIRRIRNGYGFISDPHAATGYLASKDSGAEGFYLATAHCAKFPKVISDALGEQPELPTALAAALEREKKSVPMDASLSDLESYIDSLSA